MDTQPRTQSLKIVFYSSLISQTLTCHSTVESITLRYLHPSSWLMCIIAVPVLLSHYTMGRPVIWVGVGHAVRNRYIFSTHAYMHTRSVECTLFSITSWAAVRSTSQWAWTSPAAMETPPTHLHFTTLTQLNQTSTCKHCRLWGPYVRTTIRKQCSLSLSFSLPPSLSLSLSLPLSLSLSLSCFSVILLSFVTETSYFQL